MAKRAEETDDLDVIVRQMTVRKRPDVLLAAAAAYKDAKAVREAGQVRYESARQMLSRQQLMAQQHARIQFPYEEPPSMTYSEVDRLGVELNAHMKSEAEAKAELDRLQTEWSNEAKAALAGPLKAYRTAILKKIEDLESLLLVGCALNAEALADKQGMPSQIAYVSPILLNQLQRLRATVNQHRA